jgi:hypothetical protein
MLHRLACGILSRWGLTENLKVGDVIQNTVTFSGGYWFG